MNVLKYKSEKDIPVINPFKTLSTGFSEIKNTLNIHYVNLYFNQPTLTDYLTKQALSLESLFYFQKKNLTELRRINDYYDVLFNDQTILTVDKLKIVYRYVKVLMQEGLLCLANENSDILKKINLNNKTITNEAITDLKNLLDKIAENYEIYKKDVISKVNSDIPNISVSNREKKYIISKKWYNLYKSERSKKSFTFHENIDNFILCDTTKPVIKYESESSISNYILKENWKENSVLIGETEYFKLKEIFHSTCDIEFSEEEYITFPILLLVEAFKLNNTEQIRPMYIKIKKGTTFKQFKEILIRTFDQTMNGSITNYEFSFYYQTHQSPLFPLMFSYLNLVNYSVSTAELEKIEDSSVMDAIKSKKDNILIIEIYHNSTDNESCIKLFEQNHCAYCKEVLREGNIYECEKCITSHNISQYYCSEACREEDTNHFTYHQKIEPFLDFDYNINILLKDHISNYFDSKAHNGKLAFRNLGNTYYMNSCLQCIAHCEALSTYFLSRKHQRNNLNYSKKKNLVEEYEEFIKRVWEGQFSDSISPAKLRNAFVSVEEKYKDFSQHEPSEMLSDFLNNLSIQLNRSNSMQYNDLNGLKKDALFEWNKMLNKENSIIKDLFYGLVNNSISCQNCSQITNKYEEFLLLDLPIPELPIKVPILKMEVNWLVKQKNSLFLKMESKLIDYRENATLKELREINKDLKFDVILITNQCQVIYYNDNDIIIENSKLKDNQEGKVVFIQKSNKPNIRKNEMLIFVYFFSQPPETPNEESFFDAIKKTFQFGCCMSKESPKINYDTITITTYPLIASVSPSMSEEEFKEIIQEIIKQNFTLSNLLIKKCETNSKFKDISKMNKAFDIKSISTRLGSESINLYIEIGEKEYQSINSFTTINFSAKSEVIISIIEKNVLDLYDCLNLFKENPSSYIPCENCNEIPKMTTYICKNPYYLVIHLKRISRDGNSYKKNNVPVEFKENLNIYNYMSNESRKDLPVSFFDYELFAVNVHSGGVEGGNYYAYCKVDNQWYSFNDISVNEASPFKEKAYMLFYKQKDPFNLNKPTRDVSVSKN